MVGDLDPRYDKRGGGGLVMVGGLVQRYDSGGEEVYTSGTLRKAGGGGVA